jgi:leucine-rich PPR motif-containing protein
MDISHYNALLRVYLENEYNFSPTEFLTELQSKGVEPNRVTYQRLISRYCQQGDIDGATQILEFMREKQLPVNENVFNALIMGHSNADDIESAAGILGVMSQAGLEPSADTYTTLLCGYAKKGDVDSINKYIDLCESKEIHLLDKDLLEVLYALAINGHENKIDSILSKLKKSVGFNQDAVNVILRLVNKGKVSTAMSVLKIMPRSTRLDGEPTDAGSFLIRQMVKADSSVADVLSICSELESTNMHARPVMIALEESLKEGKLELAKNLLKELKKRNMEVRQHYFWPLIATAENENEVISIVNMMTSEFKQDISGQTIRDYIIPKLKDQNYDNMVFALRNMGVITARACVSVAFHAIRKNDLSGAAEIMNTFDAYFSPGLFRKPLLGAFIAKRDVDSYIKIIRSIHDGVPRLQTLNDNLKNDVEADGEAVVEDSTSIETKVDNLQADIVGSFVADVVINVRQNKLEATQSILEGLVAQGLSISNQKAELIQNRIGDNMTTEISSLLTKLTSGELEPIANEKRQIKRPANATGLTPESLERLIVKLDQKGENTKGLKKQLLIQLIRAKDIPKTEEWMEKLKGEGYTLTSGVYALLLDLYASKDKVDDALKVYAQISTQDTEFVLDETKIVKIVQALVNNNRLDEAFKFMESNKREATPESQFNYTITCWRLLNSFVEKGDVENVNKIFNSLIDNKLVAPQNILFGPLIKVHLLKDELKEAVDKFEEICGKHRATPMKNELACKLIEAEDALNLQKITDLSTEVHGEVNSLYDLVFSFIECGRIRQARKILETPGLRTRNFNRINSICERYAEEGKPTVLEGLVEATKDLNHIDRSEIYYNLLQSYVKDKAVDKCLEMWTKMQEEDIMPSDMLRIKLSDFLKSEGIEVPFTVPTVEKELKVKTKRVAKETPQQQAQQPQKPKVEKAEKPKDVKTDEPTPKTPHALLSKAIRSRSDEQMEAFISDPNNLKITGLSALEKSKIIEALVRVGRITDATKFVFELLEGKQNPKLQIFRFYLNSLAKSGESETIEKIGKYLDADMKKEVSFDNKYCHSFVSKGKVNEYLQRLENRIDEAKTPEEIKSAGEEFPRGND